MNFVHDIKSIVKRLYVNSLKNIKNSEISNVKLIHKESRIENSSLFGNIITHEGVIIKNAALMGDITFGRYTTFNGPNSDILSVLNPVNIGSFCSIARNVSIQEYNHYSDRVTSYFITHHLFDGKWVEDIKSAGPIDIGNDVWIGTQSIILSGVKVGHGAIIAANSVVTNDIPPYSIAAGTPCKVIKLRFSNDIIEKLLITKWWDWDIYKIRKNRSFFSGNLTLEKMQNIIDCD